MVDVNEMKKQVQERLNTARDTVKGAGENARDALGEVIAKAEKAGREQFQELLELDQVKALRARAEEIEPRVMSVLEKRVPPVFSIVQDLNQRLARKSAEPADKPSASAPKKAATRSKAATARKTAAKKPAAKPAAKKPAAKKPAAKAEATEA